MERSSSFLYGTTLPKSDHGTEICSTLSVYITFTDVQNLNVAYNSPTVLAHCPLTSLTIYTIPIFFPCFFFSFLIFHLPTFISSLTSHSLATSLSGSLLCHLSSSPQHTIPFPSFNALCPSIHPVS